MLHTIGGCGLGIGMSWSSAWIGWVVSPGSMAIDDSDEIRQPGSSTPSTTGSTAGCTGTCSNSRAVGEQVVDADGVVALEVVGGRHDAELVLEAVEVVDQRVDEVEVDGVGDDRVALLGDLVRRVVACGSDA